MAVIHHRIMGTDRGKFLSARAPGIRNTLKPLWTEGPRLAPAVNLVKKKEHYHVCPYP